MPDIFDEVEEDLRAERAQSFLRRYGVLLLAGIIAVLVGTGAYVWWAQQRQAAAEKAADQFLGAAELADKSHTALAGLDKDVAGQAAASFAALAAHGPASYAVLARLRLAALQWQLNEHKEAIGTWQSVSDDGTAPQMLRDLATVVSAQHQVDTADPVTLKQRLESLTNADNPWRAMAEQIIALIDLRQGKTKDAAALFKRIAGDPNAPEGVRQMVGDLLTTLPQDASGTGAPAAGGSAAPKATGQATPAQATVAPAAATTPATAAPAATAPSPAPAATAPEAAPAAHTKPSHKAGAHKPAPHG